LADGQWAVQTDAQDGNRMPDADQEVSAVSEQDTSATGMEQALLER
jgi:hypothetical protein